MRLTPQHSAAQPSPLSTEHLQAFSHPSYFTERKGFVPPPPGPSGLPLHNQRLEWLGDAVLQLAATDFLFHR